MISRTVQGYHRFRRGFFRFLKHDSLIARKITCHTVMTMFALNF